MAAWYYLVEQTQHGPVEEADLRAGLAENKIAPDTFVWREGMESWRTAAEMPELATAPESAPVQFLPPPFAPVAEPVPLMVTYPLVLVQERRLRGKQVITLVDPTTVTYANRRGRPARHRQVDTRLLNPEPQRIRRTHRQSWLLIAPCAFFALCIWGGAISQAIAGQYESAGAVAATALVISGIAVALYFHMKINSVDVISFAVKGQAPLDLWADTPDAPAVEAFVGHLRSAANPVTQANYAEAQRLAAATPKGCVNCQSPEIVPGFATPLCAPCREKLTRFTVPLWLKIAAAVLALMVLFAATRLPHEISADLAYQRGQQAEARGDHAGALAQYQKALALYPHSPNVLRGLATAALSAGDARTAAQYANQLIDPNGQVSKDDLDLLNRIKGAQP